MLPLWKKKRACNTNEASHDHESQPDGEQVCSNNDDNNLLDKLRGGDAIPQELKYHPVCLGGLYNRVCAQKNVEERKLYTSAEHDVYPMAFSELITYKVETSAS